MSDFPKLVIMVKVIAKQKFDFEGRAWYPGDVGEVLERVAKRWISRGIANYADPNYVNNRNYKWHPKVSIIILIKDALHYTKQCLRSLIKHTQNYELILVDNGSRQDTKDFLSKLDWTDYKLITNKENKGFSYGNNQGIKAATCDYICFLNSDTLLSPNWLGKMMLGFKHDSRVGAVGPSTSHCAGAQADQIIKHHRNYVTQDEVNKISETLGVRFIEADIIGFCFIFKREVLNKIGVFDHKRYGIACHEDLDLVWRTHQAGYKTIWCRASYVHHFGHKSTRDSGLDPKSMRIHNRPIFVDRVKNDNNLYVENDAVIDEIKEVQGTIPILMITWNRLDYTKKAIKAIIENTDHPYKLLVWDNGSTDGTVDYLKELKNKNIQVRFSKTNTGLVPPQNYFFDNFKGYKYVAKVDNDTIVPKGWLSKLKEVMDSFPLFAVEADHFLMLSYNIKTNDEYYRHLFSTDFKNSKLYFSEIVGGTGTLIRSSYIDEPLPEIPGTLSGWIQYQSVKNRISAFYSGVWIERLDQEGTNKYKSESDYPEYDTLINKLRPRSKISSRCIGRDTFKSNYNKIKEWFNEL